MPLSRHIRYGFFHRHSQEKRPGYHDTFDITHQVFYCDHTVSLGKFTVKTRREILHTEEIPQEVLIEIGAFGLTEWKSTCPDGLHKKCDARLIESA